MELHPMGKAFIVALSLLLIGLGIFVVYSLTPELLPKIEQVNSLVSSLGQNNSQTPTPTFTETSQLEAKTSLSDSLTITKYLEENLGIKGYDGEVYCAYKIIEETTDQPNQIYLLSLCQEYYKIENNITPGTGVILPTILNLKWQDNIFDVNSHKTPELGAEYSSSIYKLFPEGISNYFISNEYVKDIPALQQKIETVVYFSSE